MCSEVIVQFCAVDVCGGWCAVHFVFELAVSGGVFVRSVEPLWLPYKDFLVVLVCLMEVCAGDVEMFDLHVS